ncbi:MAG TPA: hypothetical protein VK421_12655 [Pyrinomonadaceae bacterium]|nr:hypothetical protein [Pyrinomonadaceae bacterium]
MSANSSRPAAAVRPTLLAVVLLIAISGCQGPPGPAGPPGPPGAPSGGPPYVWVCTPANYPNSASNTQADVFIFNGSATTANVALHPLNKDGVNLAGTPIPGTSPAANYPGQTGSATVPVASGNTLIVNFQTATGNPAAGGNVAATVRVISDQPVAVGTNFQFSGFKPLPCTPLPK